MEAEMEYKGMTVKQSKNGNVIISKENGEMYIISTSKKYLNDDELKEIVDKQLKYLQKE